MSYQGEEDYCPKESEHHYIRERMGGSYQVINRQSNCVRYDAETWDDAVTFIADNWGVYALIDE